MNLKLFLLIFILINNLTAGLLDMPKAKTSAIVLDSTSVNPLTFEPFEEFQLNFTKDKLTTNETTNLLFNIPLISYYGPYPDGYRKQLALVVLKPALSSIITSENLIKQLAKLFVTTEKDLIKILETKNIFFSNIALGTVIDPTADSPLETIKLTSTFSMKVKLYNILFHNWVGAGPKYKNDLKMKEFDVKIYAGLFDASGILDVHTPGIIPGVTVPHWDMAEYEFDTIQVVLHHINAQSPNNGRFAITPNRWFSTFLAVAIDKNKTRVSITNFLLANNNEAEKLLAKILKQSDNVKDIYEKLMEININPTKEFPSDVIYDIKALQDWIKFVVKSTGETIAISKKVKPIAALRDLNNKLNALKNIYNLLK